MFPLSSGQAMGQTAAGVVVATQGWIGMNWILGLVGALMGIAVSESRWLLGAIVGFFSLYFLGAHMRLRHRLDALERDLKTVRARSSVESLRSEAMASAQAASEPAAPTEAAPASEPASPVAAAAASATATATAAQAAEGVREPPPLPPTPRAAPDFRGGIAREPDQRAPAEPDWMQKLVVRIKAWFTEGNVPVKIGVLVLFVGVAAALRFAVAQGYFHMPIEVWLATIAAAGIAALAFGWRERERRPVFD